MGGITTMNSWRASPLLGWFLLLDPLPGSRLQELRRFKESSKRFSTEAHRRWSFGFEIENSQIFRWDSCWESRCLLIRGSPEGIAADSSVLTSLPSCTSFSVDLMLARSSIITTPSIVIVALLSNRQRFSSLLRLQFQWGNNDSGSPIWDLLLRHQLRRCISCSMPLKQRRNKKLQATRTRLLRLRSIGSSEFEGVWWKWS